MIKSLFMKKRNYPPVPFVLFSFLLVFLWSCNLVDKRARAEREEIEKFLADNPSLDFVLCSSGLYYYEEETGTGLQAKTHDSVFVKHSVKFLNGTIIYTNIGTPDTLKQTVNEGWLLPGLDEGLTYMREGGKSIMILPSYLAFGQSSSPTVPGYSPLLVEVSLVKVKPYPFTK